MSSKMLGYTCCEVTLLCYCVICRYCAAGCCSSRCWQAAWHHQHMWHYGWHSWQHCDRQYCCVSRRLSSSVYSYQWRLPEFVRCMANLGEWPQHCSGQAAAGELSVPAGVNQLKILSQHFALLNGCHHCRMPLLTSKTRNVVNA